LNEYLDKAFDIDKNGPRTCSSFWDSHIFPETNGSKFGGGVQAEDESAWEELAAATTALVDMPRAVVYDNGGDNVQQILVSIFFFNSHISLCHER
jgi:hypothetical protein